MKVFVIGGTGVFGARLCALLVRDGHSVEIGSRRGQPSKSNGDVDLSGCSHCVFDRTGPLTGLEGYDIIVDAAGPFHTYGDDPYRLARAAIDAGANYFDLSDNAEFCAGIRQLDLDAKAAGVTVLSGMSSVPAISSAAVTALCEGQRPLSIESAILPGNKAPRGRAVIESILSQSGATYTEMQGGQGVDVRSWSEPKWYSLGGFRRQGWRIEVPDQRLFPDHFGCGDVSFCAGLELGVMRYGLGAFSWLRGILGFKVRPWMVSVAMAGAGLLAPFGTDRGGMVVQVVVPQKMGFVRKFWVMQVKNGDGPWIPGVAIRAACRSIVEIAPGAGPALSVVPLAQIEKGFSDLAVATDIMSQARGPVFAKVLGESFGCLPCAVLATHHSVVSQSFEGRSKVTHGTGFLAKCAALLFGFPPSGDDTPVRVDKVRHDHGEVWTRTFGVKSFRSHLSAKQGAMTERFGPLTFTLDLHVKDGMLHFPVRSGTCLGIPIPRWLLPISDAHEADSDGRFQFDVHLKAPTGQTLVHYQGWLEERNGAAGEN